ncbi:MAG: SGNH/GDSL hydrolase family protein, partial [Bradyrhizobium sp.]
ILPTSLCNHAVINAGISGAQSTSGLGAILKQSLGEKRASLVIFSLGTNDALMSRRTEHFASAYKALLREAMPLAEHVAVMAIPALDSQVEASERINEYNTALSTVAKELGIAFVPLPPMAKPHTTDGVHLDVGGYSIWDAAVLGQARTICPRE